MAEQTIGDALDLDSGEYERAAFNELMYIVAVARPALDLTASAHEGAGRLPVELRGDFEVHLFALHGRDFFPRRKPQRRFVSSAVRRFFHNVQKFSERESLRRLRPEIERPVRYSRHCAVFDRFQRICGGSSGTAPEPLAPATSMSFRQSLRLQKGEPHRAPARAARGTL